MSIHIDHTHDPALQSWVDAANNPAADFPIQNLPFGVFHRRGKNEEPRVGVAIGDQVLDLRGCAAAGHLSRLNPQTIAAASTSTLNAVMALEHSDRRALRRAISDLLEEKSGTLRDDAATVLSPQTDVDMLLPAAIGDYTDFYASIHHATNVGSMFRPDNPLMPNYKHLPVGYHGRASSIVISGTPVRRPAGQTKADDAELPAYGPCRLLDYELEMGCFVALGNAIGEPIAMDQMERHLFGICIVNDWSARDVQKWEYQPLGPFNAKNFATSISPWVVTLDALAPFRIPGPMRGADDPPVLDYLRPADDLALDLVCEVRIQSQQMREQGMEALRVSRGNFRDMYWTFAQMLAHHTSTGCNTRPGDLIASGTVSGPEEEARGCLLEMTWRGENPIELPDGTQRRFLQDGDEVIIKAYCERDGCRRIGLGECRGVIELP